MGPVPGEQLTPKALTGDWNRQGSGSHRASIISRVRIYTKTGDWGDTSLFDNTRVSKSDSRVDAYGEVDELNANLGTLCASGVDADLATEIEKIQKELFAVGARLADPRRGLPSA